MGMWCLFWIRRRCSTKQAPCTAICSRPLSIDEPIDVRPMAAAGLTVLSSRSHADNAAVDEFLKGRRVAARLAAGSYLKFCCVAEGGDVSNAVRAGAKEYGPLR